MSYNLFLDDIRMPSEVGNYINPVELRSQYRLEEWVIVRNYTEFTDVILEKGVPDKVSFDHDLAEIHYDPSSQRESFEYYPETGYDCAKWLCNYCDLFGERFPEFFVHSMNPTGRENIIYYINLWKNKEANHDKEV